MRAKGEQSIYSENEISGLLRWLYSIARLSDELMKSELFELVEWFYKHTERFRMEIGHHKNS